ncbi:MAG: PucR family transcriptional regulator ligand-binding domain-containing protein [Lachnospiraceae bacterium]|nr:PucR family transcriptional regulator ligand-binding domain-containing protein [Lachnospiraceae bacterium]
MAVSVKKIIGKLYNLDIELVAGKNGLDRPVTWVHMIESEEASRFLEGNEIAVTTGIGTTSGSDLLRLVEFIFDHGASAVIINVGPYIEKVDDPVKEFCDSHDFPCYVVPWRVHLSEIMRIICFAITTDDRKNFESASAFKNVIFFPQQSELYTVALSNLGYSSEWAYTVAVIWPSESGDQLKRAERLAFKLSYDMEHNYDRFAVFSYEYEVVAVMANYSKEQVRSFIKDLQQNLKLALSKNEGYHIGVGKTTRSIRCLYKSYNQARAVCQLKQRSHLDNNKVFYSELGLYRLLVSIEDPDILSDYYDNTIKPIDDYDRANGTDLSKTLECYLNHDGSVKETADELFVHRNTINYKLQKIRELTGLNLSTTSARLQLTTGLMVRNIM